MSNQNPFSTIQNQVFDMEHPPINSIYIDMEMFQDFKFGTLLTMLTIPDQLKYIYSRLDKYNDRLNNNIMEYFPALKISEESILERMSDNRFVERISVISPFTSIYDDFIKLLIAAQIHNNTIGNKKSIILNINVSDIKYPKELITRFENVINNMVKDVNISLTNFKRYDMNPNKFIHNDIFFIYEMHKVLEEDSKLTYMFAQDGLFFGKKIFAQPYVDVTLHPDKNTYDQVLVSTEVGLNMYCDFKYISATLAIGDDT